MSLDTILSYGITIAEVLVLVVLVYRRTFRLLPIFSAYVVWTIISDLVGLTLLRVYPTRYLQAFLVLMPIDSCLQFCVIVELAWSVLRPVRSVLPRAALPMIAILVLLAGAALWPIAGMATVHNVQATYQLMYRLLQTFSLLRVLLFLVFAGFSQILAIGWRDRELQVATGLGFYSLVSLGIAMVHTHLTDGDPVALGRLHHSLDRITNVAYFCSLLYWVVSFAQKEAVRKEFTPQMQNMLLAVSGAARANRVAVESTRRPPRP